MKMSSIPKKEKNKDPSEKHADKEKCKSPAQLTAEASLSSQKLAKISEENTKLTLDLQKEETKIHMQESKRNNAAVM